MKKFKSILFLSFICLTFFNCETQELKNNQEDEIIPEGLEPIPEPEQTEFVVALGTQNITLNPIHAHKSAEIQILTAIYEGLMIYHPFTLSPLPGVAHRWEISKDKLTYTFYLREDAYFSNGDPVTAQDFRESWLLLLHPDNNAEYSVYFDIIRGAEAYRKGENTDPDSVGIFAISERVLKVELEKPASHFLKLLCILNFSPLHPSNRKEGDWGQKGPIIGNGPFQISKKTDEEIKLTKNHLYWDREQVKIDSIRILFIDDPQIVADEFNDGIIHWTKLYDISFEDMNELSKSKIVSNPLFATFFIFFVCKEEPWNDYRVRRGLALMLPWEEIRSSEYSIYPTSKLIPEIPKYPEVNSITEQNIDAGLSLLKEAGFPNGEGLPPIVILISQGNTHYSDILRTAWQENLSVEVQVKEVEAPLFFDAINEHDYTISSYTWIGDFADPLAFLQMWTANSNLNEAQFSNLEYERLIQESLKSSGLERYQKMAEAEELLLHEAVVMPIDHYPAFNVIDYESIEGWYPNILDIHPFKYIEFKGMTAPPGIVRNFTGTSLNTFKKAIYRN